MKRSIALIVFLTFILFEANSNTFEWGIKFQGIGDNREFFSGLSEHETILGTRVKVIAGLIHDNIHQFNVGVNYFYEFGSEPFDLKPDLVLNYTLTMNDHIFKMGAFEKTPLQSYPIALFSRLDHYYRPNMEGILLDWDKSWGRTSIWVDWRGRQSDIVREQFVVGHSLNLSASNFIFDEYVYMTHKAGREFFEPNVYIEDNLGAILMAGYIFSSLLSIDKFEIRSGLLLSLDRNRGEGMELHPAFSSYSSVILEQGQLGFEATYNFGDMHQLPYGDQFYTTTSDYFRGDVYVIPFKLDNLYSKFTWSFHLANGDLEHQQMLSIVYQFGNIKQ